MGRLRGTAGAVVCALTLLSPAALANGSADLLHGPLPPHVHLTGDGEADALYRAAYRAEHARSPGRDPATAAALYCRAAARGHPGAGYRLGWLFLHGTGVPADDRQAAAWLEHAAAHGSRAAAGLRSLIPSVRPAARAACRSLPKSLPGRLPGSEARVGAGVSVRAPSAIRAIVAPLAARHDLDPNLVLSVIAVESAFDANAVSPKNAQGLMQLIPATAARFGVRDPFDARQNVAGGVRYLAWLIRRFDGELDTALAAYNAGEGTVDRYGGIPPYPETQAYVRKVRDLYAGPPVRSHADGRGRR
ncbi:lytic transglycosylase domain-containing protein [Rhodovibrio sodomensis]|uniref:lytic transglycosylase domain-containing protein n=1 Tax=Rhodovibrio sodomensis TaxID=1088 RepID=UPI00308430DC